MATEEQNKDMVAEGAPVNKEEQPGPPDLAGFLSKLPGAPSKEKIESWKKQYGEVMVSGFDEEELFVFRPLTRREFTNLQKKLRTPEQGKEPMDEFQYEEEVVAACVLWSSVTDITSKGGTITTLSEQIMQNSNFTNPQVASMLVMKL